ncbi:tyrosine-type recombinase/integrase [Eoetvoesiella caeni]|uniref:Site-specific recombinase XerD n=1 Tax=Eoetvoesiella caeni TaxID=645616 RepID=A0A366GZR9_9BURK|nr:site-specific integrase [Eoetvoesiella caeni]MCI2811297.1 site-specific integrase [Eoetvoesiella caeni]NYT57204.1 site-specific integrase [Eoetvoesiella caeni]RBP33623.1 site-specific recombinase XerD [Eoetvoesiella caeni]
MNEITPFQPPAPAPRADNSALAPSALGIVHDDWHAAEIWLERLTLRTKPVSQATLLSYRMELKRLRWYCDEFPCPTPSQWSYQDATAFIKFLQVDAKKYLSARSLPFEDPAWTPFKVDPSIASINTTKKVLISLYGFWAESGYILRNPFAGLGHNGAADEDANIRSLSPPQLAAIYKCMDTRPRVAPTDYLKYVRNRFIIRLLERSGLRANEVIMANMTNVIPITDPQTQQTFWSLKVEHGKGGTKGRVFLDADVMEDFRIYRRAFGFAEMPAPNEKIALILSVRTQPITRANGTTVRFSTKGQRHMRSWREIRRRQTLWDIVKEEVKSTVEALKAQNYLEEADALEKASTHWLRHTFGTNLINEGKDIRLVAQAMRHKNIRRTMMYTNRDFLDVARAMSK